MAEGGGRGVEEWEVEGYPVTDEADNPRLILLICIDLICLQYHVHSF